VPGIDYVDLRFDDRIYVRPAVASRAQEIHPKAPAAPERKVSKERPAKRP
jgi:hypothetical protein